MYKVIHTERGDSGKTIFVGDDPFEAKAVFESSINSGMSGAVTFSFNNRILYRHRFDAVDGEMDNCIGVDIDPFTSR